MGLQHPDRGFESHSHLHNEKNKAKVLFFYGKIFTYNVGEKMQIKRNFNTNDVNVENKKVAIIVAEFNKEITESLKEGALRGFKENNLTDVEVFYVPGAYEIPFIGKLLAKKNCYDAIVTLGCVIRGDTTHYDYVCNENAAGVSKLSYDFELPVLFGLVTVENEAQAWERAGDLDTNKGYECALSAIELIGLVDGIKN